MDCVAAELADSANARYPAYIEYLTLAPGISNPFNGGQCGMAREYFGYDENQVNDAEICEGIPQLKTSRDLSFLDDFFAQGTPDPGPGGGGSIGDGAAWGIQKIEVPALKLSEVDRGSSGAEIVQNGPEQEKLLFDLERGLDAVNWVLETIEDYRCPDDCPFPVAKNICSGIANVIFVIISAILMVLGAILELAGYNFGFNCEVNNIQPIEMWEDTQAIFGNMVLLGDYLQARFQEQNDQRIEHHDRIGVKINSEVSIAQTEITSRILNAPSEFDYQVEFVGEDGTKRKFMMYATFNGSPLESGISFIVKGFDETREYFDALTATTTEIVDGAYYVSVEGSTDYSMLLFDASFTSSDSIGLGYSGVKYNRERLVNLASGVAPAGRKLMAEEHGTGNVKEDMEDMKAKLALSNEELTSVKGELKEVKHQLLQSEEKIRGEFTELKRMILGLQNINGVLGQAVQD